MEGEDRVEELRSKFSVSYMLPIAFFPLSFSPLVLFCHLFCVFFFFCSSHVPLSEQWEVRTEEWKCWYKPVTHWACSFPRFRRRLLPRLRPFPPYLHFSFFSSFSVHLISSHLPLCPFLEKTVDSSSMNSPPLLSRE